MNIEKPGNALPILILLRHAARDFEADRLSSDGHRAASQLDTLISDLKLPVPTALLSSPKLRTQMTLRFLADSHGVSTIVDPRLDERGPIEKAESFQARVADFLADCDEEAATASKKQTGFVKVACSHFDWLEMASILISSDDGDIERSEPWASLHLRAFIFKDGLWRRHTVKRKSDDHNLV